MLNGIDKTFTWKSKGAPEEHCITPATSDNSFAPKLSFIFNERIGAQF